MRFLYAALICTAVCSTAHAEPAYLDCNAKSETDKEAVAFSVKLDEANGKITHTYSKGGAAFNAEGFFSADEITYQNIFFITSSLKMTKQIRINRTDLSVTQTDTMESPDHPDIIKPTVTEWKGTCSVVKVGKRKI